MKKFGLKAALFSLHNYTDPLSLVTKIFRDHFLRDRFNYLNKFSPFSVSTQQDKIPLPFDTPKTFSDLMDERAIDLLGSNNTVLLSWSGGVDSTAALIALIKNCPQNERDRINVTFSKESILENPTFYSKLPNLGVTLLEDYNVVDSLRDTECDVVTFGWHADQLFGSDIHLKNLDLYHKPWLDALDWHINKLTGKTLSNKYRDILFTIYSSYANQIGVNLDQWSKFAWLFNFGVKWTGITSYMQYTLFGSDNLNKHNSFFGSHDFQRYAVTHNEEITKENIYLNPKAYKTPLKQYIFAFDGDSEYFTNKSKVNSWKNMFPSVPVEGILLDTDEGLKQFTSKDVDNNCGFCRTKLIKAVSALYLKEDR